MTMMADQPAPPAPPPPPRDSWGGYPPPPPFAPAGWPPPPSWGAGGAAPPPWGPVGSGRFRAMGVGELLDAIFTLYRRNFVLIAAISATVQVPYAALQYVLFQVTGVASLDGRPFPGFTTPRPGQALTPGQLHALAGSLGGFALALLGVGLLGLFVALPLAEAATTRAVSDRYLDRPASLGSTYATALRRLPALILQSLILLAGTIVLVVAAGLLVFVLGAAAGRAGLALAVVVFVLGAIAMAVTVYVRTSLAVPAIVLEGSSGWGGLVRSWALTRGLAWRILGIRLLVWLITAIVSGVITTLLALAGAALDAQGQFAAGQVASAIANIVVAPITYIAITLLYYDARIRKEGFDIEMLARSL